MKHDWLFIVAALLTYVVVFCAGYAVGAIQWGSY